MAVIDILVFCCFHGIISGHFQTNRQNAFYTCAVVFLLATWFGLFFVPLSDLVAVYLLIFALASINKAYSLSYEKVFGTVPLLLFFLSGLLLYAAYNIRTIYLFAMPFVLIISFINRKIGIRKSLAILAAVCIGALSMGSVRGYCNQKMFGEFSLAVKTNNYSGYDNLFLFQLLLECV